MKYTVGVQLIAYDFITVEAESPEGAQQQTREILRAEQKYSQTTFRPILGVLHSVRLEAEDSELLWVRGQDPLKELLVQGPPVGQEVSHA